MKKGTILLIIIAAMAGQACERKPDACLDVPHQLEAGKQITLQSCSKHYDFLTWDFGDGSSGFIGDTPEHNFDEEGDFEITLTAYSNGAYKSEEVKQSIHASYRYLYSFEVIGTSDFGSFEFDLGNGKWKRGSATGTFTEDHPYEAVIWPEDTFRILPEPMSVELYGIRNGSSTALLKENVNFKLANENPVVIESALYTLKIYWTFK